MQKLVVKITWLNILVVSLMMHISSLAISSHIDAHVHGVSEMTIAIESNLVEIEMISPAMNLVGFEHTAKSPEDIVMVERAIRLLQNPEALFTFSGGSCVLAAKTIDPAGMIENNEHEHKHEKAEHNNVSASYRYRCEEISFVSSITVNLFDFFHELQKINAMWLTEERQGAITLNTEIKQINFK